MKDNFNRGPVPFTLETDAQERLAGYRAELGSAAMFRWWIPAGFLTREEIEREIRTVAEHGFRGLEICVNMADTAYSRDALREKGWGTTHWREMYRYILETGIRYGVQIDTTISPGWPAGIPGIAPEDDCSSKELITCTSAPFRGTFAGALPSEIDTGTIDPVQLAQNGPPPAMGEEIPEEEPENRLFLEAVTAARIESTAEIPMTAGRFAPPSPNADGPKTLQYRLAPDSLQVITDFVQPGDTDTLCWTAPDDGEWLVFAFWRRGTAQTNRQGSATAEPCYAVDHMNRRGAEAVIAFWEKEILDDSLRQLLRQNNGVIFEDSIELDLSDYAIHWGMEHLERFRQHRGYDLTPYLPLLTGLTYMDPKAYKYELGDGSGGVAELGTRLRNDYCQLVTELYAQEHIGPIQEWAAGLGMGYRSQGYGLPFDLMEIAGFSHGPEGESLGFGSGVRSDDRFRTVAGGAHAAGRPIISDEMGAVAGEGYRWTWKSMLDIINSNLAGGANLIIFHGLPYAVSNSSKWPGYSPFGFGLAGQWGPRQPEWDYIDGLSDYLRRTQCILQGGKPAVDAAVLSVYYEGFNFGGVFPDQTLAQAGYTYDLLSVNNLKLPDAIVSNCRLFPDQAGYRALILDNQRLFTAEALQKIIGFAKAGLPIVIVGELPACCAFLPEDSAAQDAEVRRLAQELAALPGVIRVANEAAVPEALQRLGIQPALQPDAPAELLPVHRRIDGADYYYVLYRGSQPQTLTLTLSGQGAVSRLNPWNGTIHALASEPAENGCRIQLTLQPMETAILRLGAGQALPAEAGTELLRISEGWTLHFERWEQNPAAADTTATRKTAVQVDAPGLQDWLSIPALGPEASGIGTYVRTITVSAADEISTLRLEKVLCQSVHLRINGTMVPVDHLTMTADVRGVFRPGENTVEIIVVSTLGNQLIAYGAFPAMPWMPIEEKPVPFGLCGDVVLMGKRHS